MLTHITGTIEQLTNYYYTYHIQTTKEILFVGYDKLQDIMSFKKTAPLEGFNPSDTYTIIIHNGFSNRFEAINDLNKIMADMCKGVLPKFNMMIASKRGRRVMCVETGVVFKNANEACASGNIAPARMCNHLMGRKGHKTIYGLTYKYVD